MGNPRQIGPFFRVTIIGGGAVGTALARALRKAGVRNLTLVERTATVRRRLKREFPGIVISSVSQSKQFQGYVILTVGDREIPKVVRELTQWPLEWERVTVLHTAGVMGSDVLLPLRTLGAGVAAWHPYQTFLRAQPAVPLGGVTFGISGTGKGRAAAIKLTRFLGGKPLLIREEDRALYHASAVLACGFVAAQLQMAEQVLGRLGISERRAREIIDPIARQTVNNAARIGAKQAMTGPAVRGDAATIKKHLAALKKVDPETAEVYRAITKKLLK